MGWAERTEHADGTPGPVVAQGAHDRHAPDRLM